MLSRMTSVVPGEVGVRGRPNRNSTADRTLEVLLLFDDHRPTVTAEEVSRHLGVGRSTTYRYLQSLLGQGFLEEAGSGTYRLGPKVLDLARLARRGLGLSESARPVMRQLVEELEETVLLTRRSGDAVVCLEREEAERRAVRLSYSPGQLLPLNAGASAHVLLAWEPEREVEAVLRSTTLAAFTPSTLVTVEALRARLAETRTRGYAFSRGELDPDVVGVAVPIHRPDGSVIAALSLAALSHRVRDDDVPGIAARVRRSADEIALHLG